MIFSAANPFSSSDTLERGKKLLHPFAFISTPQQSYSQSVAHNIRILRTRFPHRTEESLKSLLLELDNNMSMVIDEISKE